MWKITVLSVLLFPITATANEKLTCPEGTQIVSDSKQYKGKDSRAYGCVNSKGRLNGPAIIMVGEHVVEKCLYINGLENGTCYSWYFSGEKKRSMQFKDGELNGEIKVWYRNGNIDVQAFYKNGKPDGKWKFWDEKGNLIRIIHHHSDPG